MPTHTQRLLSSLSPVLRYTGWSLSAFGLVAFALSTSAPLTGQSSSEQVCISVQVIGYDDGDPGSANCIIASSSADSSSSATSEDADGEAEAEDGQTVTNDLGGRYHSIAQSRIRMLELIDAWRNRRTIAPELCTADYDDLPDEGWYIDSVHSFYCRFYLDHEQPLFRAEDGALRAELAALLVRMQGGISTHIPDALSFSDARADQWYVPYIEDAAAKGWYLGYDNCYLDARRGEQCLGKPEVVVTRAEAAALIVRAFDLEARNVVQPFDDVAPDAWYSGVVQIAADHCILRGDAGTRSVRPEDSVNRAELITMLDRAERGLDAREGCFDVPWPLYAQQLQSAGVALTSGGERDEQWEQPAILFVEGLELCSNPSLSCFLTAARHDVEALGSTFLAMATLPSWSDVRTSEPSEQYIWLVLGLLLIGLDLLISRYLARR